jgi:hypothetical protein
LGRYAGTCQIRWRDRGAAAKRRLIPMARELTRYSSTRRSKNSNAAPTTKEAKWSRFTGTL